MGAGCSFLSATQSATEISAGPAFYSFFNCCPGDKVPTQKTRHLVCYQCQVTSVLPEIQIIKWGFRLHHCHLKDCLRPYASLALRGLVGLKRSGFLTVRRSGSRSGVNCQVRACCGTVVLMIRQAAVTPHINLVAAGARDTLCWCWWYAGTGARDTLCWCWWYAGTGARDTLRKSRTRMPIDDLYYRVQKIKAGKLF